MRFLNPKTDFAFKKIFEIANKCGLSPAELDAQERREIFIQDQRGAISLAEQRGGNEGSKGSGCALRKVFSISSTMTR